MKLVEGHTLARMLNDRPSPSHDLPRFLGIFEQVCHAVAFAHSKGVIHRDLTPANIMVGAFGEVQVMDWGLAKVIGPASASATSTRDERINTSRGARRQRQPGIRCNRVRRHTRVYGAGASARRDCARGRTGRCVCPGCDVVRDPDRRASLCRRPPRAVAETGCLGRPLRGAQSSISLRVRCRAHRPVHIVPGRAARSSPADEAGAVAAAENARPHTPGGAGPACGWPSSSGRGPTLALTRQRRPLRPSARPGAERRSWPRPSWR